MTTPLLQPLNASALRIGKIMVMNQIIGHPNTEPPLSVDDHETIKSEWAEFRETDPEACRDHQESLRAKLIEDHHALTAIRSGQPWQQVLDVGYGFEVHPDVDNRTRGLYLSDAPYDTQFQQQSFFRWAAAYLVLVEPFVDPRNESNNNKVPANLSLSDRSDFLWTLLDRLHDICHVPDAATVLGVYFLENMSGPPEAYYCRGTHLTSFPEIESEEIANRYDAEDKIVRLTMTSDGAPALIKDKNSAALKRYAADTHIRFEIV